MAIEQTLAIYIVSLIGGLLFLFFSNKKKTKKAKAPKMKYEDIMSIIDTTISRELSFRIDDYTIREVVIPDFEYELKSTTLAIMDGIGTDLLETACFYHPKDYYILYVSRQVRHVLIQFINSKKMN